MQPRQTARTTTATINIGSTLNAMASHRRDQRRQRDTITGKQRRWVDQQRLDCPAERVLSLSKVSHGNHQNPQGDEYPEAERCSDQQTCVHCAFPFIRARLKSQARVRGNAIYITSAACVQKDRDESASLYFGPFGASLLGLAGSLLLSRSASACCAFLNASYSGVPGLGGTPLGIPPSHSGA